MAPIVKIMSQSGFVYEKNNFVALVDKEGAHADYHQMMDFIKGCKLKYAMLEAPTLYCEVVEEFWTTAVFNSTDETITFNLKGNTYCINADDVQACLKLPENKTLVPHTDTDVTNLLNTLGYLLGPNMFVEGGVEYKLYRFISKLFFVCILNFKQFDAE